MSAMSISSGPVLIHDILYKWMDNPPLDFYLV